MRRIPNGPRQTPVEIDDHTVRSFRIDYLRDGTPKTRNMEGLPSSVAGAIVQWTASEPDVVIESIVMLTEGD